MLLIYIFVFILGSIVGSFLNVVIDRFNTGRTLGGRSKCDVTGKTLAWFELVPIFSYLFLGGRSRHTKTKLSIQYPLVEFFTGLVFALIFCKFWPAVFYSPAIFAYELFLYFLIFSLLIVIFGYDWKHKIIPDWFVWQFNFLALVSVVTLYPTAMNILAGPILAIPFFLMWLISKGKWIGFGDVKLALGMGWLLGLSSGFSALIMSFWIGAIFGILLLILKKPKNHQLPFAPFLILATFIAFLYNIDMQNISNLFSFLV